MIPRRLRYTAIYYATSYRSSAINNSKERGLSNKYVEQPSLCNEHLESLSSAQIALFVVLHLDNILDTHLPNLIN